MSHTDQPGADPHVYAAWSKGSDFEINFWNEWIRTKGLDWPDDFRNRLSPESPFPPHLRDLISAPDGATINVLDVGSGPLTKIGRRWDNRRIEVTALDVLADEYNRMMDRAGIRPPVRPRQGQAEQLTRLFPHAFFDLSCAANSIDHSHDPVAAIQQMLAVTRRGAFVQLDHAVNEAVTQDYVGFHQWNFCIEGGRFIIWRPGIRIDVAERLADVTDQVRVRPLDNWVSVSLRKR